MGIEVTKTRLPSGKPKTCVGKPVKAVLILLKIAHRLTRSVVSEVPSKNKIVNQIGENTVL